MYDDLLRKQLINSLNKKGCHLLIQIFKRLSVYKGSNYKVHLMALCLSMI